MSTQQDQPEPDLAAELQQLRDENERLRLVLQAVERTNSELDVDAALTAIVDAAHEVFGADRCLVLLSTPGSQARTVRIARGLSAAYQQHLVSGHLPLQAVAERMQPFTVRDVIDHPPLPVAEESRRLMAAEGFRGMTVLILRRGPTMLGVMVLYFDQPRELSPGELVLAQTFADQAAIALVNARDYEFVDGLRREREASQRLLQSILDCLNDLVIVWDPALRPMLANARARKLLSEGEGLHQFELPPARTPLLEASEQRRPVLGVEQTIAGRTYEIDAHPLLDPASDELIAVVLHARDLTDKRRLEKALQHSEERFRLAIELSPVGLVQLDVQNAKIVRANRAMASLAGRPEKDLPGLPLFELFRHDAYPVMARLWGEVVETGQASHDELPLARPDTKPLLVSVSFGSLSYSDGSTYVQCVIRDVTRRQRLQAQLIEQEKLAAIGQLASGVAHEIRNPLGIIASALFDLEEILETDDADVSEDLGIARDEIVRVQEIIKNVLEFAHAGPSERQWLDLRLLLERAVALLGKSLSSRDIALELELSAVPRLWANEGELRQVILNLLTNAYQATPDGGRIAIRLWQETPGNLQLVVQDSGEGIAADDLSRVFNPFFTTKPPGQGTGLGLSIVATTIRRHHGEIEVDSAVGQGTTFRIQLPIRPPDGPGPDDGSPLSDAARELE